MNNSLIERNKAMYKGIEDCSLCERCGSLITPLNLFYFTYEKTDYPELNIEPVTRTIKVCRYCVNHIHNKTLEDYFNE